MKIIIINTKSDFSLEQQDALTKLGSVHFLESEPDYSNALFSDEVGDSDVIYQEFISWYESA